MASVLSFCSPPPAPPPRGPDRESPNAPPQPTTLRSFSKRELLRKAAAASVVSLTLTIPRSPAKASESSPSFENSAPAAPPPPTTTMRKPAIEGIANTKSWFQFYGDGFSVRVPPLFEDVMEPEDYNAGLSLYGDKVKPKTFAARFASMDGSEVLSVVIRSTNQLKITFLEAKDITDLGSLKAAAKIFVPGGANINSARIIKIKEDETIRTYYFYEFGVDDQHVALVAAVNSGKAYIAGAAAPQSKWETDGIKLRSAAISLSVL